ncbi:MAG TPA: endonuclease/exonuclease/phosphatase family protein [Lacipirellulaceae bacterium]|jgi:endonuclease/exonuclease/phosphatase (EEP) superfamily protein YafD|nr:endonuclease/exonuclease/phosphatase family protein [Lacipirellulaceae bacterium]
MERPESFAGLDPALDSNTPHRATNDRQSLWFRAVILLAWATTLALAAIALLRLTYHDGRHPLIWINAFTRYVYLPAYVSLIFGIWQRHRWLVLANAAVVGCHLFWMAPDFLRDRRADATTQPIVADQSRSARLRIFFANVRSENQEFDAFFSEIARVDPDIIVLAECTITWRQVIRQSSFVAKYPYGSGSTQWLADDVGVFSKIPISRETQPQFAERVIRVLDVPVGRQILHVVGLHAPRPMNFHENDYDGFWQGALPLIESVPHPLVVVGDCNATQYSLVYQQLKASSLRSAHEDRGRGYATSWPNGTLPLPPIRIDQAFLSPDVACTSISEGEGSGSDHKPLILDVQIGEPH